MYCENCGKELDDSVQFCPYCGKLCAKKKIEAIKEQGIRKKNYKTLSIFVIVGVIALTIMYISFWRPNKQIVGKWSNNKCEVEYTDDGLFYIYSLDGEYMTDGTWQLDGDTLVLTSEDPIEVERQEYTITEIDKDQMILEIWNENTEEYKEYVFYKN